MSDSRLILVTGATGYVGGRLVPRLLAADYQVRCLVRDPARLQGRAWLNQVELAPGDMFQPDSLVAAMRGVRIVYYLVHSPGGVNPEASSRLPQVWVSLAFAETLTLRPSLL
jgi:uncharacterized protein YbjT (DUF2867 family)